MQLAILASLNIADEYFQVKKSAMGWKGPLRDKTKEIYLCLDEGLIGEYFLRFGDTELLSSIRWS
ncbi:MAG: cell division protein ZapA [Candidatus Moduliflexus flocculans]|nr:cell division protein ZapA [Candidatus Moduliflexus flocculans]